MKEKVPGAVTIFVDAPLDELERRLRERATESAGEIEERIALAAEQRRARGPLRLRRRERRPRARRRRVRRASSSASSPPAATMARPMIHPRIDQLLDQVDSRYALVIVAAKRARQINNYHHQLGEGTFDEFPPPLVQLALEELPDDVPRGDRRGQDHATTYTPASTSHWRASGSPPADASPRDLPSDVLSEHRPKDRDSSQASRRPKAQ